MTGEESRVGNTAAGGRNRRLAALGLATLMLGIVFFLETRADSDDAIALLYVVPVAIVGFEFGLWASGLAALAAIGLMGAAITLRHTGVDSIGIATRTAAIAFVALIAGRLGERRRALAELHSELDYTRLRIADDLRNARSILDHNELERGDIANRLHEQAAQMLAAALMALTVLEKDAAESRLDPSQLDTIRGHMRDCLEELRGLADGLRPAALVQLGLPAALEALCATRSESSRGSIAIHTDGLPQGGLLPGVEATAYRTVGELLSAVASPSEVRVSLDGDARLRIVVTSNIEERDLEQRLAATRARLQIFDGSLWIETASQQGGATVTRIEADLPVEAAGLA